MQEINLDKSIIKLKKNNKNHKKWLRLCAKKEKTKDQPKKEMQDHKIDYLVLIYTIYQKTFCFFSF